MGTWWNYRYTKHTLLRRTYPRVRITVDAIAGELRIDIENTSTTIDLEHVSLRIDFHRGGIFKFLDRTRISKSQTFGLLAKGAKQSYEIRTDEVAEQLDVLMDESETTLAKVGIKHLLAFPLVARFLRWVSARIERIVPLTARRSFTKWVKQLEGEGLDEQAASRLALYLVSEDHREPRKEPLEREYPEFPGRKFALQRTHWVRSLIINLQNKTLIRSNRVGPIAGEWQINSIIHLRWTASLSGARPVLQIWKIKITPDSFSIVNPAFELFDYSEDLKPKVFLVGNWICKRHERTVQVLSFGKSLTRALFSF